MRFLARLGLVVSLLATPPPLFAAWLDPPPRPHAIHILALPYLACPHGHRLETVTSSLAYWGWRAVPTFQPGPMVDGTPTVLSLWQREGTASLWVRHGVPESCVRTDADSTTNEASRRE